MGEEPGTLEMVATDGDDQIETSIPVTDFAKASDWLFGGSWGN